MWLLIPAKTSTLAKRRLSPVLSDEARAVLARLLLARLLTLITGFEEVADAVVVSGDAGLRAIARLFGYHALPEPEPDLNAALEAGRGYAIERGAESMLVLPTDLPWLSKESLAALFQHTTLSDPRVVIAYDKHGLGTNALFQQPADAIPFHFGIGSAKKHRALAVEAGLPLIEVKDPELAWDLDLPEDWSRLVA
ncbi:MAG: 2-phospho-L-lactate guanylyltransferase [Chloroflexota bacterium]|nr:2-phospho-L-lactate guanylyltransferase [Chloroflexota bacterium]